MEEGFWYLDLPHSFTGFAVGVCLPVWLLSRVGSLNLGLSSYEFQDLVSDLCVQMLAGGELFLGDVFTLESSFPCLDSCVIQEVIISGQKCPELLAALLDLPCECS